MISFSSLTCVIGRHCSQVVVELGSPLVSRLEPVQLEEIVKEGQQHRVVVRQHKQVHRQQICARLQKLKRFRSICWQEGTTFLL